MAVNKIKFVSGYNKKTHEDFYLFHLLHKSTFIYILPIISFILLFMVLTGETKDNQTLYIIFIVFGILFLPFYLFYTIKSNVRKDKDKREGLIETVEITKEKIVRSNEKNGEATGKETISWYQILTIYEVSKYFYVYITNENGFVLNKDSIEEGTIEQFRNYCEKYLKHNNKGKIPFIQNRKVKRAIKNGNTKGL